MYPGLPTVTARYAVERLAGPPRGAVTNTAPTTQLALALARLPRRASDRIWGALPVEEVEGHDVDPAYDVRPVEGLGRAPIRSERLASERLAGLGKLPLFLQEELPKPEEESSPGFFGISTPYLVLAGVAAVALGMVLKR
jgi:hypothetical protein